jgi:hypothetical protein
MVYQGLPYAKSKEDWGCNRKWDSVACHCFRSDDWAKNKNATDYADYTDSKSLADDAFELERPGAEVEEQCQP